MAYVASVQFRIDAPSTDSRHYRASVGEEPRLAEPTGAIVKVGPTANGVAYYAGSFASETEAREAVSDFLAQSGMAMVERPGDPGCEPIREVKAVAYLRRNQLMARMAWPSERLAMALLD